MRKLLLAVLLVLWAVPAWADTHTAASCSVAHLNAAFAAASAGDTIQLPAGTCHWTTYPDWYPVPANLTILGAGSQSVVGGGDATVIIDDIVVGNALWNMSGFGAGTFRISGITFQGGVGIYKNWGMLNIVGPTTLQIDHVHFNTQTYSPANNTRILTIGDRVYGAISQSILDLYSTSAIYVLNGSGADQMGNATWAADTNFGTAADYLYIEDNVVRGTPATHDTRILDCFAAGKYVVRFNNLVASSGPEDHATGHSTDDRGCRAHEMYGNYSTDGVGQTFPNFDLISIGGGPALVWGNTTGNSYINGYVFNVVRKNNATYTIAPTPTSWGYCGTQFNGTGSNWDGNTNTTTGYPCIDQIGRGKGDLITGWAPSKVNSTTGKISQINQALEPVYIWNNTVSIAGGYGGALYADDTLGRITANVDYYPQASGIQTSASSPFNGTSGVGWGTIANRPSTCTVGVAYWATNEGSWNTSTSNPYGVQQNGADGRLYKCTATNTWELYYTPYTYPHPLNPGNGAAPPSAPTNVRIR